MTKIINKNFQYNVLSLINVFIGFLFILYLGRKFGAGKETDVYFLSLVIINYLGYFVQACWEAMSPYYVEEKKKSLKRSYILYSVLLNNLILISVFIVSIYFIITNNFNILSAYQKKFLNIMVFYLIFQNILFFNKTILNLEHFYSSFYIVDIFVYSGLILIIYFFDNIFYIAYGIVLLTFIANGWQFYLIFKKANIRYYFVLYNSLVKEIYKNSIKLKIGSLFYGIKDILIVSVFTSFGSGIYSLYSYANKFAGVILQVVNAPIINKFISQANYLVVHKKFVELKKEIKSVLMQTSILFIISTIILYFLLPYIIELLFINKFNPNQIQIIQKIFLIMSVFYFIIVVESPFARLGSIFKLFNFGLFINLVFALIVFIGYLLFKWFRFSYITFLFIIILAQSSNFLLAYIRYRLFLKEQNEI